MKQLADCCSPLYSLLMRKIGQALVGCTMVLAMLLANQTTTFALGVPGIQPVVDYNSIAKLKLQLDKLKEQVNLSQNLYDKAKQQYAETQQIRGELEGQYGYGSLLDSGSDFAARQWSPNSWDNALNGVAGGNPARYHALKRQYEQQHVVMSVKDYQQSSPKDKVTNFKQQAKVNQTATVQASYAFNDLNQHLKTIHQLTQQINTTQNAKASMDLTARLVAEVAYLQTETLKMNSLMNQQLAQQGASDLAGESINARFNRLPEN